MLYEKIFTHANGLDFIGDIHGHADKLEKLLHNLGYKEVDGIYRHPEGRQVVFLGDWVDRGPQIRRTLEIVRKMVKGRQAYVVTGNHEGNLIAYLTKDFGGEFLHAHNEKNMKMHAATIDQFQGHEKELEDYINWFKTLPVKLEITTPKGLARAVHAVWDTEPHEEWLANETLTDEIYLENVFQYGNEDAVKAYRRATKGVKVYMPKGHGWPTDEWTGTVDYIRAKWWLDAKGKTYREMAFLPKEKAHLPPDILIPDGQASNVRGYGVNEPIVFLGHYWMSKNETPAPLTPNIVCTDYSVGRGGPAVAYRWDGEKAADAQKFVTSDQTILQTSTEEGKRILPGMKRELVIT